MAKHQDEGGDEVAVAEGHRKNNKLMEFMYSKLFVFVWQESAEQQKNFCG